MSASLLQLPLANFCRHAQQLQKWRSARLAGVTAAAVYPGAVFVSWLLTCMAFDYSSESLLVGWIPAMLFASLPSGFVAIIILSLERRARPFALYGCAVAANAMYVAVLAIALA